MRSYFHRHHSQFFTFLLLFFSIIPYLFSKPLVSPYNNFEYQTIDNFVTIWAPIHLGSYYFNLIPVDFIVYLVSKIIGSVHAIKLFHIIFLAIASIGTYQYLRKLIQSTYISFIGALFYIYGIYGQFVSYWHPTNIVFALLPWITLVVWNVKERKELLRPSILLGFLLFFLTGVNLTLIVYVALWVSGIFIFKLFTDTRESNIRLLLTLSLSAVFSTILSLFYYCSFVAQFLYQNTLVNGSLALESATWKSSDSWMHELIREMGAVPFYYSFHFPSYPNAQVFIHNPFLIFISYLFPLLAFISVFLYRNKAKEKENKKIITFFMISLIFLFFMAMGVFFMSPTRFIYNFLYTNIKYFSIFRDAYKAMLLIHFIYTVLISLTVSYLYVYYSKFGKLVSYTTIICIFILSYQFWGGTFLKQFTMIIPQYWIDYASYYTQNPNRGTTLLLPELPFHVYDFTTQRGQNTVFFRPYFRNNIVYYEGGSIYDDGIMHTLFNTLHNNPPCFSRFAGFLGISTVINQHDLDTKYYETADSHPVTPLQVENFLNKSINLTESRKFGKLTLYTIDHDLVYPTIYIPKTIQNTATSAASFCDQLALSNKNELLASIPIKKQFDTSVSPPSIGVSEFNSAIFSLTISKSEKEFLLIFNNRYDGGWKLFQTTKKVSSFWDVLPLIFSTPYNDANHLVANTFSNGWKMSASSSSSKFTLIYMPQVYFYWSLLISGCSILLLSSIFIIISIKKHYENKRT